MAPDNSILLQQVQKSGISKQFHHAIAWEFFGQDLEYILI